MSKRFTIDFDNRRIIDNKKNEYLVFLAQFKEVLNQLNDENEQLKSDNKDYIKRYSELFDEYKKNKNVNKQLKEEIETLHEQLAHFDE